MTLFWRVLLDGPGEPAAEHARRNRAGTPVDEAPTRFHPGWLKFLVFIEVLAFVTGFYWSQPSVDRTINAVCFAVAAAGVSHVLHMAIVISLGRNDGLPLSRPPGRTLTKPS